MGINSTHTLPIKGKGFSPKSLIQHKVFVGILKLGLAGILIIVLYHQLFGREDLTIQALGQQFVAKLSLQNLPLILLVLILMPLNWFFETQKWLSLMQKIEPIALKKALEAVLAGVTFSLFTPNRIGEYTGRVLMVSKENRFMSVFVIMVGSFSQWIVLVVGGWWGLIGAFYMDIIPISKLVFITLVVVGIIASIGLFVLYFNLRGLVAACSRYRWTKKWASRLHDCVFQHYSPHELLAALSFSTLRYLTYSFQYLLLLYFFGFDANIWATVLGIMIVYLLQTGIPLPPSTGLLARGNIALLIFGYFSTTTGMAGVILASTFSLWIINVVLPALIGAFFLARLGWGEEAQEVALEAQ